MASPSSTNRRRPSRAGTVAIVASLLAVVVVVAVRVWPTARATVTPQCTAQGAAGTFVLSPDQAANATTIAAVGKRLGLPDHAVSIALAAALQESRLHNLAGGDRDSIGLFQQRPSQGWGTPRQIADPVYAATAFYSHLAQVPDWASRSVTDAAQAVQRSAAPSAYADWENEARTLAAALTGEVAGAFSCRFAPRRASHEKPRWWRRCRESSAHRRWARRSTGPADGWWRAGSSATRSSTASTRSPSPDSAGRHGPAPGNHDLRPWPTCRSDQAAVNRRWRKKSRTWSSATRVGLPGSST